MKSGVRRMLERDGVVELIGAENIYPNVYESVADLLPDGGVPPSEGS
jgi:hypothetical protein